MVATRASEDAATVEVVVRTERRPLRLESDTLFAFDRAELANQRKASLDEMLGSMTAGDWQEKKIPVSGPTDRIGSDAYNRELSKRPAAAVHDYPVSNVVPSLIEVQGVGRVHPSLESSGEGGAALIDWVAPNCRTEIDFSAVELVQVEESVPAVGARSGRRPGDTPQPWHVRLAQAPPAGQSVPRP